MIQKNKYSVFSALLLSIILFICMISSVFLFTNNLVYADYNYEIVNFNQIANWYSLSNDYYNFSSIDNLGYSTITLRNQNVWWARLKFSSSTFIDTHKYYIKQDNDKSYTMVIFKNTTTNASDYLALQSGSSAIITGNNDFGFGYQSATVNYFPLKQRIILIDLTLMGIDDYTLEQCNNLFVSDYYNYTTGYAVNLSNLNSFAEGMKAVLDSMNYQLTASHIYNTAYAYKGDLINATWTYNDTSVIATSTSYGENIIAIPLGVVVDSGRVMRIRGGYSGFAVNRSSVSNSTGYICWAYKYNDNFIPLCFCTIADLLEDDPNQPSYIDVNIPYAIDTIYLMESTTDVYYTAPTGTGNGFSMFNTSVYVADLGITALIENSRQQANSELYMYYSPGGAGYNSIKNYGYQLGLADNNPYTFKNLMAAVVEAPLNAILEIFNFDFMGYNMKNFITLILTLCLLLAVIRLFIGGK